MNSRGMRGCCSDANSKRDGLIAGAHNRVVELSLSRQGVDVAGCATVSLLVLFTLGLPEDHASLPCTTNSPLRRDAWFLQPQAARSCAACSPTYLISECARSPHTRQRALIKQLPKPQLHSVCHLHSRCKIQGVGTRSANRATCILFARRSDFPQQQTLLIISCFVRASLEPGIAMFLSVRNSGVSRQSPQKLAFVGVLHMTVPAGEIVLFF
jgi:hypothetical protein